jgi:diguanylate cyclase (GGDEF)-like protein
MNSSDISTSAILPVYHEKVCRDLVRRGVLGSYLYLIIWIILASVGRFFENNADLAWGGVITLGLFALLRIWLSINFNSLYQKNPVLWEKAYALGVLGSAFSWGGVTSVLLIRFLPDSPIAYLAGIATSGFAVGGTTILLSHMRVQQAHQAFLLLPAIIVCLYVGESLAVTMGLFLILGWFFVISVGREINQQYYSVLKSNEVFERRATTDKLTGIANRRYFDELINSMFHQAERYNHSLTVLLLDVDFFKLYNDTYGHAKGDECLRSVAQALSNTFRRSTDLVARYGGEEFVALVPDQSFDNVAQLVNDLLNDLLTLEIPHSSSSATSRVTVSIGSVTITPSSNANISEVVEQADKLLYRAKSEGRNRAIMFDADSNNEKVLQLDQ